MATGDRADMERRISQLLPPWFGDDNPLRDALVTGAAAVLMFVYGLYAYARSQTRVATATGIWLDIIARDFYGSTLLRASGQSDDSFRLAILSGLFRPRATRGAVRDALTALTGNEPVIVEPWAPADCGAYGVGYTSYGGAGAYGSVLLPAQAFITVYRPVQPGIATIAGYGNAPAGYGVGSQAEYASLSFLGPRVTDADIYATIDATKAAGVIPWTRIINKFSRSGLTLNGDAFTIDGAPLLA